MSNPPPPFSRRVLRIALLTLMALLFATVWIAWTVHRTQSDYHAVKRLRKGWKGVVHRPDSRYGFRIVPYSEGWITFYPGQGDPIPVKHGPDGIRLPLHRDPTVQGGPNALMALGCSFTYGDACYGRDTYVEAISADLGLEAINAGTCSYGLQHMVLRAEELFPKYKPGRVILQYSPWLVDRAIRPNASSSATVPVPYYAEARKGSFPELIPPAYVAADFTSQRERFRTDVFGLKDRVLFQFHYGFPFYGESDAKLLSYRLRKLVGRVPRPSADHQAVTRAGYTRLADLCRTWGVQATVVVLQKEDERKEIPFALFAELGLPVVDTTPWMWSLLEEQSTEAYRRKWGHWRGDPPVFADGHPNPEAHRLIADRVLHAWKEWGTQGRVPSPE